MTKFPYLSAPIHQATRLWKRLVAPITPIQDTEQLRKSQALTSVLLAVWLVSLVLSIVGYSIHPVWNLETATRVVLGLVILINYGLSRRNHYKLVSLLSAVAGSIMLFGLAFVQQGHTGLRTLDYLIVIIVFSSLFLSVRLTLIIFVAQMLGLLLWNSITPGETTSGVIGGPFSFNLFLTLIMLLVAHYRDRLEIDRQAQLAASEARYRSVIAALAEGIVVQDKDGVILACNTAAETILGLTADQIRGRTPFDPRWQAIHEDGTPFEGATHPEMVALKTGKPVSHMIMGVHRPDGTLVWLSINAQPISHGNTQTPDAVVTSFDDITERRQVWQALQESEERYRLLIDYSPDAVLLHCQGKIVFANPTALALLGATRPEDLIGRSPLDIVHPDYQGIILDRIRQVLREKKVALWLEQKFVRLDGTSVDVEASAAALTLQGKLAVQVIARDITERKRLTEALAQERTLLRTLIDNLPDSVYIKDSASHFVTTNTAHLTMLGATTLADVIGKTDADFFPPDLAARYYSDEQAVIQSGQPLVNHEEPTFPLHGKYRWSSSTKLPLRDSQGAIVGMVGITRDITEQRQATQALEESEKRYRQLFNQIDDAIFIHDVEGHIMDVNQAACDQLGYTRADLLRMKTIDIDSPDYSRDFEKHLVYQPDHDRMTNIEGVHLTREGRPINILVNSRVITYQGQSAVLEICRDITERKLAEQQALELARKRQQVKVLTDFIEVASHDFRTPLTTINLGLYPLRKLADSEKQRQQIQLIEQQVGIINQLVERLLIMARLDSDLAFNFHPLEISTFFQDISLRMRRTVEENQLYLVCQLETPLPPIQADSERLGQAILELLENAVQHTPSGGTITLRAALQEDSVVIEVHDTGLGIAPDDLPYVFDRLYRADKARSIGKGNIGLGLAIAKRVIEIHRGRIEATSQVGRGSIFRVFLPRGT